MRKKVIGPDVGAGLDFVEEIDDVESLPHPEAVVIEEPGYQKVVISGTGAIDEDGTVLAPGDPATQTENILSTIEKLLSEVGGDRRDLVRVRVYTEELSDEEYQAITRVRERFFHEDHQPASTLVSVEDIGVDGMQVEIDADAIIPEDSWQVTHIFRD